MKHNLTNEQVARVFAMYFGAKFIYGDPSIKSAIRNFEGILTNQPSHFPEWANVLKWGAHNFKFESCKLLLTPLSAISDEDAIEVAKIFYGIDTHWKREILITDGRRFANQLNIVSTVSDAIFIYQYLIQKGYAVPLFIEVGHPDNGKTAIELGIAISRIELQNDAVSDTTGSDSSNEDGNIKIDWERIEEEAKKKFYWNYNSEWINWLKTNLPKYIK